MDQIVNVHRIEWVALFGFAGLTLLVFELVRRREIKEKYSFLWFITCFLGLSLIIKRDWLERLSFFIGVYYPPSALFLIISFFMIVILVHYSMVLSKLMFQNQRLAQKIALLEEKLLEQKSENENE